MQTARLKTTLSALAGLSVLGLGHAAQAQAPVILSLTSPVSTASVGDTLTFTLNLTGGTNVAVFTTEVSIDSAYLSFVVPTGAPIYKETFSGFDGDLGDMINPSGALDISYGALSGSYINNVGPTALGTFQVHVDSPLPAGGTFVTLAPPSDPTSSDPSSVTNGDETVVNNNELTNVTSATVLPTAAPEPSGAVAGFVGLAGLGLLAARRRRNA